MDILQLPTLISFLAFMILGLYVFVKNRRQWLNLFFAVGMGSLALMEFGNSMMLITIGSYAAIFWKKISLAGECLVPVAWLAFSISFARNKLWYQSKKLKTLIIGVGVVSVFFTAWIPSGMFVLFDGSSDFLAMGGIGKVFYILFLIISVAIVANLEHTLRQSKGDQRTKIRPLVLGLGGLFSFLIFTSSQNLLFSQINLKMIPVSSSFFFICAVMIAFSVVRHRLMDVNLYMSRFVIYNSLTLLVVGGYLVFVGAVSQVIRSFNIIPGYPLEILFFFVAILLLFSLFLSDRIRWKARMLINRHFYRSRYDYRHEWFKFAEGLSLKIDIDELAITIGNIFRDSMCVDGVSLWLYKGNSGHFTKVGPSSSTGKDRLNVNRKDRTVLIKKKMPCSTNDSWARDFLLENSEVLNGIRPELIVPLVSGKEMLGLILLGKKKTGEGFMEEDIDLLRLASAQITSAIVNAKLYQELIKTKEMDIFHRFSSFLLHDLKNLVSSLSLVVQNAGEHMSDPEFQKDTLDTIERSVTKMEALIARLSNNTVLERPNFQETDLNELASEVVSRMGRNAINGKTLKVDLGKIPKVLVDREQIEKVIMNLILNAVEATDNGEFVTIQTETEDEKVIFSVADNGIGMSPEFIENTLFRPFKSTKKKGFGIGLYQCKTIVETHQGEIEVESEKGVGSIFRMIIPASCFSSHLQGT